MRFLKSLFLFAAILSLDPSSVSARPISSIRVPLTICLTNEAGVPWKTVFGVEARVTTVFRESAIELRWLNYDPSLNAPGRPTSCGHLTYPDHLMIHWIPRARNAPSDVLGEAFLDEQDAGVIADLFLDHVQTVESQAKVGFANLLAYATAHEVGHLLLGVNSHSSRGIMHGHFHGQELGAIRSGALAFEHDEEVRMHSRLLGDPLPFLLVNGR